LREDKIMDLLHIVHLDDDSAALIWHNGLIARVEGIREGDGVVTYLAVAAPGSKAAPLLGLLKIMAVSSAR
jgi:hypothetical protein